MKKADGVFEGGGVKGIGLVGALIVAEERGYTDWQRVAGTSAGAIVASLLAAGYSAVKLSSPVPLFRPSFSFLRRNVFHIFSGTSGCKIIPICIITPFTFNS